ncbi:MAG TPA: hypothetical protein VKH42_20955 [Vicinamibacterales bacterium]|nr:hypothetical protein [Vicinamibacterales bacterium]
MKSVVAPLILAIVLALAGAAFSIAGNTERRLSDIHSQLATLQYSSVTAESEDAEQNLGLAKRVPQLGAAATMDLRDVRTTADYWRGGYTAIAAAGRGAGAPAGDRDANGTATESDPRVLLRTANAAFRGSQKDNDRAGALRKVDAVIKNYADVIRSSPTTMDAAYNYEYAIRIRDVMNKTKGAPAVKAARASATQPDLDKAAAAGDLPGGPTLHGRPGGPPPASDMSQFKIVIPKRGDERKENPEAGKGGTKVRRG